MPENRKDRREKMAKEAKTNAMRMLDRQKVKYEAFSYECDEFIDGIHSADKIGGWMAFNDAFLVRCKFRFLMFRDLINF